MPVKKNMEGQKCGRLLVLELAATPPGRRGAYWLCECECGCRTVAFGGSLRNGGIKSCGCLLRETVGYGREGNGAAPALALAQPIGPASTWRRSGQLQDQ
jgi:hypothetical protein